MEFRALNADEIECRVGTAAKDGSGASVLLYKDARCDMAILDETVGAMGWQRDHKEVKGNLFCGVGIRDGEDTLGNANWNWKWDCGTESRSEKEKGEASDSFKRACFNWGIGRELYTAPFIWLPDGQGYNAETKRLFVHVSLFETEMVGKRRIITRLQLSDKKGNVIFNWVKDAKPQQKAKPKPQQKPQQAEAFPAFPDASSEKISKEQADELKLLASKTHADVVKVLEYYKVKTFEDMDFHSYERCRNTLNARLK